MEVQPKPYMRSYTNFHFANITCLPSSIPRAKTQQGNFLKFIILCIIPKCFEKTISKVRSKKVVKTALRLLIREKTGSQHTSQVAITIIKNSQKSSQQPNGFQGSHTLSPSSRFWLPSSQLELTANDQSFVIFFYSQLPERSKSENISQNNNDLCH